MDNREMKRQVDAVMSTLEKIEVHGKQNLLNLGGCIAVLEDLDRYLDSEIKKEVLSDVQEAGD